MRSGERAQTLEPAPGPYTPASHGSLVWTDYGFLLAALPAILVVVDPLEQELAADPVLKHLSLMLALPVVALAMAGGGLKGPLHQAGRVSLPLIALWPLLLLAAAIVGGSCYARFSLGIQNTFLNVGLYVFAAVLAAVMVQQSDAPGRLVRGYLWILLAAASFMAASLIANFGVRQVYHEQIFLVVPMAVLLLAGPGSRLVRWTGCAFFVAMIWMSQKYTSYIVGVLVVGYLVTLIVIPRLAPRPTLARATLTYWVWAVGLSAGAVLAVLGLQGKLDLPTGNVDYRMHTYVAAWERFQDSPLWGTLFAVEAVEKFRLYSIGIARNVLPTHSDVLDLLAHGGVLAVALWVWGLVRVGRIAYARLLRPSMLAHPFAPCAHTLAVMSLAGVLAYAFNPILLQPSVAYLLWTNLGLLVGLSLRAGDVPMGASVEATPVRDRQAWTAGHRMGGGRRA